MPTKKSFKIGEYAVGGIIQVELKGKLLSVKIFKESGFDWREPGCSMCLGMKTVPSIFLI